MKRRLITIVLLVLWLTGVTGAYRCEKHGAEACAHKLGLVYNGVDGVTEELAAFGQCTNQ